MPGTNLFSHYSQRIIEGTLIKITQLNYPLRIYSQESGPHLLLCRQQDSLFKTQNLTASILADKVGGKEYMKFHNFIIELDLRHVRNGSCSKPGLYGRYLDM